MRRRAVLLAEIALGVLQASISLNALGECAGGKPLRQIADAPQVLLTLLRENGHDRIAGTGRN